ncbi:MAG: amino acid ABC transporter permease [Thermoplasmata archaeon]|nr:amino acid ABC transporter permease [Euryarchaeota archaeon]RLF65452.1 MAG: amino acid ABC transporter permease [Thermoplasmata archaeon]
MTIALEEALKLLLEGAKVSLELSLLSIFLGMIIGLLIAIMEVYGGKVLRYIAMGYENAIRGIPLLVIYFILYYSIPSITGFSMDPFTTAIVGLGIRSSAYQSQIFRGAIQAVEEGQIEAALSLGMSKWQVIRHIILPQALRIALPGWMNEYTIVLKDTSIAIAIGVVELTRQARYLVSYYLRPFLYYGMAALIYLVIVLSIGYLAGYLGKKYQIIGLGGGVTRA